MTKILIETTKIYSWWRGRRSVSGVLTLQGIWKTSLQTSLLQGERLLILPHGTKSEVSVGFPHGTMTND
jgi:hypothetical protein